MKALVKLTFLALALVGCSELGQRRQNENCGELYDALLVHWAFDSTGQRFTMNDSSRGKIILRDRTCLVGLSERSIKKLFGAPSLIKGDSYYYFISPLCNGPKGLDQLACEAFKIVFSGDTDRVRAVELVGGGG